MCGKQICGETERSLHARMMEHRRAANNPPSDPDNAVGQHYLTEHCTQKAALKYTLLDIQPKTVRRKIVEAFHILKFKPEINDKAELNYLCKYIVD